MAIMAGIDLLAKFVYFLFCARQRRSNMSPVVIKHCGKSYIITSSQTHVLGADPENGEILWTFQHNFLSPNGDNTTIVVNVPTYKDSCLLISNGWDVQSSMLEIAPDGKSVKRNLQTRHLITKTMVLFWLMVIYMALILPVAKVENGIV